MARADMELQEKLQRRTDMLKDVREIKKTTPSIKTEVIHNYHSRADTGDFTFEADEPESVIGGTNKGPRPLQYFLSGFGFCEQAQYMRNAIMMGIEIDDLSIEISGEADSRDAIGLTDKDRTKFDKIHYITRIETSAPLDEVRELVREAESCCYVHGTLEEAVEMTGEIIVNGEVLKM